MRFRLSIPLLAFGLFLGGLAVVRSQSAAAGDPAIAPTVAEVTRIQELDDGRIIVYTALVDTTVADPDAAINALVPDGVPASGGAASAAFALWRKWAAADIPVPVYYNFDWDLTTLTAFPSFQWAMDQWNGVSEQGFKFVYAGSTTAYASSNLCALQIADRINSVRLSYILPDGVLGSTCAVLDGTSIDGARRVTEFDLQLDGKAPWSMAAVTPAWAYDMRSTILHELGHALGLAHSTAAGSVMLPALGRGQQLRTLTADDIAGIRALYGTPTEPAPTATATATSTPTATTPTTPAPPAPPPGPGPTLSGANRVRLSQLARDVAGGPLQPPPAPTQPSPTATPTRTPTPRAAATATPSPTATPTRTPTPIPQPPPSAGSVTTARSTWYTDSIGAIWVVGEVVNGRSQSIQYVKVTANFYSASNQLLATDFGFSTINVVAAGADSPFSVLLLSPPAGIARVSVQVTDFTEPSYRPPATGLLLQVTNTYTDSIGAVHVVGSVTNTSGITWKYVQPVVGFYNSAGDMVREDFTFTSPSTLGPGQSGTFDAFVFGGSNAAITTYRTWVDALP